MTFEEYYRQQFRGHLQRFKKTIPSRSKYHGNDSTEFTIQYSRLTKDTRHLDLIPTRDLPRFAMALFMSVLLDEVCYTHFKSVYPRFRSLTMYPKFIGDCLSMCSFHLHPQDISEAMNYSKGGLNSTRRPDVSAFVLFDEARSLMKEQVFAILTNYLPEVDPNDFWRRCVDELPVRSQYDITFANKSVEQSSAHAADEG